MRVDHKEDKPLYHAIWIGYLTESGRFPDRGEEFVLSPDKIRDAMKTGHWDDNSSHRFNISGEPVKFLADSPETAVAESKDGEPSSGTSSFAKARQACGEQSEVTTSSDWQTAAKDRRIAVLKVHLVSHEVVCLSHVDGDVDCAQEFRHRTGLDWSECLQPEMMPSQVAAERLKRHYGNQGVRLNGIRFPSRQNPGNGWCLAAYRIEDLIQPDRIDVVA